MGDTQRLVVGAEAPSFYELDIASAGGIDLSAVTAAAFRVRAADGTESTWTATVVERDPARVRVRHVFAPGDLPRAGLLTVYAVLTLPSGSVRSGARQERVYGPWDV